MALFSTLSKAPIVEAILDVRMAFPKPPTLMELATFGETFEADFPKKEEETLIAFDFRHETGKSPSATSSNQGVVGLRLLSSDSKQIVQFRKNGFAFNLLAPYSTWDDFIRQAAPLWQAYRKRFPNAAINRIGVRNINLIEIPLTSGAVDLEDYFTARFSGPDMEGLTISDFLTHGVFREVETGLEANWILSRQPPKNPNTLTVALDIEVFSSGEQARESNPLDAWNEMRDLKNRLFFSSFTQKGLSIFAS